jgi:hypothetical protein
MEDPTFLCMLGVLLLFLFVASRFFGPKRPAPPGTYDDPNTRSGGSFGTAGDRQRTYDDPNTESGGSFGAPRGQVSQRSIDDPNTQSGGSFGGGGPHTNETRNRSTGRAARPASPPASRPASRGNQRPKNDDPNTKSGGSFGG